MISISLKDAFPHKRSVACTEAIADTNDNQTDPMQADGRDAFVEVKRHHRARASLTQRNEKQGSRYMRRPFFDTLPCLYAIINL